MLKKCPICNDESAQTKKMHLKGETPITLFARSVVVTS